MLVLLLFSCLFGTIFPEQIEYGTGPRKYKVSDKLFLERQRDLLHLFEFINEPDCDEEHLKLAKTYSIEENLDAYVKSTVVKNFVGLYRQGLISRREPFSLFYYEHLEQAISLFKVFYYARDFNTLYKTAVWARNNVNPGLFLYAFSTALVHRADTFSFIIPPIYEIYPYFFFNGDDIHRAVHYRGSNKMYTIYANYSDYYLNLGKEQALSYYLEDIGINAFYYYCNVYYPFWMDGEEFGLKNDRRGDQFYYLYQQLLARYYLERLSNDLGEIEFFNYEEPFKNGYYSSLRYPNGWKFPDRPNYARLTETLYNYGQSWTYKSKSGFAYTMVQDFERRLRDSIDAGFVLQRERDGKYMDLFTSDQINILGNAIENNSDSPHPRFYGPWQIFARHLLGYSYQTPNKFKVVPSALEHFETALRDPAFYQLYKRIVLICQQYKQYLPPYTYNELSFPGVKIEKMEFDRLITYFDYFDSDITNVAGRESHGVKIRQKRLNHKPFSYKITVNSEKATEAGIRVFLGPKYDEWGREINISENRMNFVELDVFQYKLQPGQNIMERNSRQLYWYVPDRTTYRDLYQKIVDSINNTDKLQLDSSEAFYGFPNRFLLPKGKRGGQVFQIYVFVNQFRAPVRPEVQQNYYFHRVGTGMNYIDDYPFGFPFDRAIASSEFRVPNAQFQDVVIYHKSVEDLNSSQSQDE